MRVNYDGQGRNVPRKSVGVRVLQLQILLPQQNWSWSPIIICRFYTSHIGRDASLQGYTVIISLYKTIISKLSNKQVVEHKNCKLLQSSFIKFTIF